MLVDAKVILNPLGYDNHKVIEDIINRVYSDYKYPEDIGAYEIIFIYPEVKRIAGHNIPVLTLDEFIELHSPKTI